MPTCDPWAEIRAKVAELAVKILFWEGLCFLDPDDVAQEVVLRLRRYPLAEGPSGWLLPERRRRLAGFIRNVARELRREREAALGGRCIRSLEPGLPIEGGEPVPGEPVAPDPGASPELVAARLAALTSAQARIVMGLLDGEELADIASTLGITGDAARHLAERARERVARVQEVRMPPPGDFPGPFTGRRAAWNRPYYLWRRGWAPSVLARDAGISLAAMQERLRRIARALEGRTRDDGGRSRGEIRPRSSSSCGGARGSVP